MWEILKRLVKKEKREDKGIKIRERKVEKSDEETLLRKSIRDLERREVESVDTSLLSKGYKIDYPLYSMRNRKKHCSQQRDNT